MARQSKITAAVALLAWVGFALASCGGGGSNGGAAPAPAPPAEDPFGLTVKEPLAILDLPTDGGSSGTVSLVARFPNLSFASAIYFAGVPGEDRIAVVQQSGYIRAFANDASTAASTLVLDLSATVLFDREQGLLGLAFDPDFVQNRYIYLHYSVPGPRSVISRYTWDGGTDSVDPASEKVLLEIDQPFANHNGGMLAFGPDGFLYIAMGDGGSGNDPENNAQNPSNLLGSMLRIDVHPSDPMDAYDIPLDNPTFTQSGARPETYAIGLRNPFRFSFDRQTGQLWLGDVGQNAIEEIDIIEAGGNYGWRVFEGTRPNIDTDNTLPDSAFTPPLFEYGRGEGVAVIGGYVYRGNALPALQGKYLYSDFGSGTVWALESDGQTVMANEVVGTVTRPTSFGEDNHGEVYIVSRDSGFFGFEAGAGGGGEIPVLLSETGLFTDLANLTPAGGLIEYTVNHPFWSDGASKRRWIGTPEGSLIEFESTGPWEFPLGTVVVKHFEIELTEGDAASGRRLETRVLVNTPDGWQGVTYRWNPGGTDADLLTGRDTETLTIELAAGGTREQRYEYPSRTDCLRCHTEASGRILGVKTRQLNADFDYPSTTDNQLRSWNNIAMFSTDIGSAAQYEAYPGIVENPADVALAARAYLDVNCAQCHQPGGPAPVAVDLRFDTLTNDMNALGVVPLAGDLGIADARIVAPGSKEQSVLWQRMQRLDDERMPPLSSHVVDDHGVSVVGQWIDAL